MVDVSKVKRAYIQELLSEKQVAEKFGISPNAVRRCLDKLGIQRRSRSEAVRCTYITRHGKKDFSLKKNLTRKEEELKVAGSMLYWGEGAKQGTTVTFSNSDPEMIKVFMEFLRKICGVSEDRLRLTLHYYEDHNREALMKFWSDITQISLDQFHTPYMHERRKTGTYRKPSKYGTVQIRYNDTKLLETIKCWISSYTETVLGKTG